MTAARLELIHSVLVSAFLAVKGNIRLKVLLIAIIVLLVNLHLPLVVLLV